MEKTWRFTHCTSRDGRSRRSPAIWAWTARRCAHVHRAISVAFELGIAFGYSDLEFKGHRLVNRAEMASFITRTLGHTNLRPEGLTAQSSGTGTLSIQVSMRDAEWGAVDNEPIDVFGSTSPDDVIFDDDGECVSRYVARVSIDNSTTHRRPRRRISTR